jgi:pimeloyl-ACP methyl ester carboxylesterase
VHGWGGSKHSNDKYAQRIVDAGFTFVSYSTRGMGDSFGQANLADVNVEGADLRSIIGQIADEPRLHVDPSSVGVFGASYGGAHSLLAAIRPRFLSPRGKSIVIRTVAPLATWSELTGALRPNGRRDEPIEPAGAYKFSFIEGLYIGGCADPPLCSNYPDYLKTWNAWIASMEPNNTTPVDRQIVDGLSGYRSIYWSPEFWQNAKSNPLPMFLAQGWTDDLFPVSETLRLVSALKSMNPNYPVALYFGDVGHPRARNKPEEVDFVINQVLAWMVWYLEGQGTQPPLDLQAAITRSKDTPFAPGDVIRVASYDQLATASVSYSFSDRQVITFEPANSSGVFCDPLVMVGAEEFAPLPCDSPPDFVPGDVAAYEVPVGQALLIAGQPQVTMTISTTGIREQFNVRLFDLGPDGSRSLITRGTYTLENSSSATITVPTYGNLWPIGAADILRLEITNVDSPYLAPSKVPSASEITHVVITVPVR